MKVSLADISAAFDALVAGSRSRKDLASWATRAQTAEDKGQLEFDPPTDEKRIWEGISYLTGVDLKCSPSRYLHTVNDFVEFREKLNL